MANIQHLPIDVQFLIVDFLSIDDCYTLQEVDKNFFKSLQIHDSFWAKKLFEKHIQYLDKSLNLFKYSESPVPYYVPTSLEFNNFKGAKALWDELMQNQKKLNNAFRFVGIDSERVQLFSQRVYTILANPAAPLPSLKRETQCIPTSSCFENFLTEIHFDVYPKARPYDAEYLFLEEASGIVQEKLNKSSGKGKAGFQKQKSVRSYHKKGQNKARVSRQNIIETIVNRRNENRIQAVFVRIQDFIKSHCLIIRNYLLSLNEDRVILKEYRRCWKEFTYSMIEMNSLIKPYENLLNINTINMSYYSVWKGMLQTWLDEVFGKVALKVKTSFQKLLMDTITSEVVDRGLSANQKKRLFFGYEAQRDQEKKRDHEKVMSLLLKSFIALSDISLCKSDFSLSGSIEISQFQPKVKLISFLYPKIKSFIETAVLALYEEPHQLSEALNTIKSVIDTVFNEEILLEKIPERCLYKKGMSCDNNEDEQENFEEIAGQYKIVSNCKWNTRLSEIYQSMTEEIAFC